MKKVSIFLKENKKVLIRSVLLGIAGIILGLSIYNWNAKKLVGNELPMPFGFGMSVVLSGSMEPELSVNDLVFVVKAEEVKVGDVVVFQSGRSLTIHRIIRIDGDEIVTQGDANNSEDAPIKISDIKGKMSFAIPFVGAVFQMFKQPLFVILIFGGALLLTELSYRKEKEEKDDELDKIKDEIKNLVSELKEEQSSK